MVSTAAERRRSFPFDTASRIAPPTIVLIVLLAAGALVLAYAGRHLTFFYDEWAFVLQRRGGGLSTYLDPHNGHLVVLPVIVYKILFAIFGLHHYTPYRLVTVALHVIACAELYVLARRRVGPWLALAPTVLLLFLGSAWQVLLWPFQISYLGSVVGGLGALILLETESTRRRDIAVAGLLTVAVGSSGLGLAFIVGCAALVLMRRDPWRRLWVVVVPLVLFGIWYLGWATGEHTSADALLGAPQYVASAAAGASAGLAGLDQSWGPALALLLVVILAVASKLRTGGIPTPMLVAVIAAALTFWILAAVTRADSPDPTASRYIYAGAVFILIALSDAMTGMLPRSATLVVLGLLVLGSVVSNTGLLRAGERGLRLSDASVRTTFGAAQLAAPVVAPGFMPDPVNAPQVEAGPLLAAMHDLGSPALTLSELEHASASQRVAADHVLVKAERLGVRPGLGSVTGTCVRATPGVAGTEITARPGAAVTLIPQPRTHVAVYVRRLADTAAAPLATALVGPATITFPSDAAPQLPWHVRVAGDGATRVCVS